MKKIIGAILSAVICCTSILPIIPLYAENVGGFNTNLKNPHPINGSWKESSEGLAAKGDGDCFYMSDSFVSDFSYSAKTKIKGNGAVSLVFRSNENGSKAYVANVDLNRGDARLFKFPATGVFEFGSFKVDKSLREYELRVDCVGDSIKFYVNGALAVSTTDSSYSAGYLGLLIWSNDAIFQDVNYTEIKNESLPNLTALEAAGGENPIIFSEGLAEFHGKLPYEQASVCFDTSVKNCESLKVSATFEARTILKETEIDLNSLQTPEIPLSVGVTEISLTLSRKCDTVLDGEIFTSYKIILRRLEEGQAMSYDISYADLVKKMTDLSSLSSPVIEGETSGEFSSYDRRSVYNELSGKYEHWDANDDHGDSLKRESDGGLILAELQGAGALVRFWSAEPRSGHIKIFIDGQSEPAVDMPFYKLFEGEFPFNLSGISYDSGRGKNCYLPISFNSSCKVVVYGDWGRYYHVGYITFPEGTTVEPFSLPLSAEGQRLLLDTEKTFTQLGASPTLEESITVPANGKVKLFSDSTSGAITQIALKIEELDALGADWTALSELAISAYWDGESAPSVWTTLGGFFGSVCGLNEYSSLPMGVCEDGTLYAFWYMPYSEGGELYLQNDGERDYKISFTITAESITKDIADSELRFHAKWNRLKDPIKNDRYPDSAFLSLNGSSGRFVGTSMHIYKEYGVGDPTSHPDWWWGEGDEKFFVDGEKFPSWFGTGSEDYFGYAWGSWTPFDYPYNAQPFTNGGMWGIGNRLNNRFHILDSVPFTSSFEACIEKYHRDGYSNQVVTNYFYLEKGASDPYTEVSLTERTCYFEPPYPEASLFYEGEDMKIINCTGMDKAETQEMSVFGKNWSGSSQLIFKAGAGSYVKLYINVPEDGLYDISAYFTKAGDFGIAHHYIDGKAIDSGIDLYNNGVIRSDETEIASSVELTAGLHELEVRIPSKNSRSSGYFYGLDCLELSKVGELPDTGDDDDPDDNKDDADKDDADTGDNTGTDKVKPDSNGNASGKKDSGVLPFVIIGASALAGALAVCAAVILTRKKK